MGKMDIQFKVTVISFSLKKGQSSLTQTDSRNPTIGAGRVQLVANSEYTINLKEIVVYTANMEAVFNT
jgi:hypothetical protein